MTSQELRACSDAPTPRAVSPLDLATLAVLALALGGWFLRLGLRPVSDMDAWLHLRIGRFLLDGGRFGDGSDPFSVLATQPYTPTQWLAEVLGAVVQDRVGLPGVAMLRVVGLVALMALCLVMARRVADAIPAAIAATVGFVGTAGAHAERPQLLGMAFVALTVLAGWRMMTRCRPAWWLVGLFWVWAMVHGTWAVGLALLVVFVAATRLDHPDMPTAVLGRLVAVPVAGALAVAMTPLGPRLLLAPWEVSSSVADYVSEWQPLDTRNAVLLLALTPIALCLLIWARRASSVPWSRLLLAGVAVALAFSMGRLVAVAALLAVPLLAETLQSLRATPVADRSRTEVGIWSTLAAVVLLGSAATAPHVAAEPGGTPQAVLPVLSAQPPGAVVLADQALSGWVIWAEPQLRVVVDPRSEVLDGAAIEQFIEAGAARPGWAQFLDDTATDLVLMPQDAPLSLMLDRDSSWTRLGGDGDIVLFGRSEQPTTPTSS